MREYAELDGHWSELTKKNASLDKDTVTYIKATMGREILNPSDLNAGEGKTEPRLPYEALKDVITILNARVDKMAAQPPHQFKEAVVADNLRDLHTADSEEGRLFRKHVPDYADPQESNTEARLFDKILRDSWDKVQDGLKAVVADRAKTASPPMR